MLAGAPAQAEPDGPCGHLYSHIQYGPFDYRHEPSEKIAIVLEAHFQPYVESLRGNADTLLGGAIDYTLRALPNYARALVAMTRLAQRDGKDPPRGAHFTVECYYIRALKFRPDDNLVRMLFADYLIDKGRGKDAAEHLDYVDKSFDKDDPFTSYNLGLLYMKLGDTAKARTLAQQARLLGNPADGLENELKKAGAWAEPAAAAAAAASSASAPADAASAVQVAAPASAPAP
ncbi:MAG: ABC transporter permease [Paucibacter sp.]|nr:ABC transporter permease [Roseateles sp.]